MDIVSVVIVGAVVLNSASIIAINKKVRKKDAEMRVEEMVKQFQNAERMEERKYKYTLVCDFAGADINADERCDHVQRELRIYLDDHDWCKFQSQPFYQDLMSYLDSL